MDIPNKEDILMDLLEYSVAGFAFLYYTIHNLKTNIIYNEIYDLFLQNTNENIELNIEEIAKDKSNNEDLIIDKVFNYDNLNFVSDTESSSDSEYETF